MSKFERFEDIESWKEGCRLTTRIYEITRNTNFSKDWGLKDQIQRAAVSVPSNISEGFERGSRKEFIRFLVIAQ
jgi:S23 ribosomal protein.